MPLIGFYNIRYNNTFSKCKTLVSLMRDHKNHDVSARIFSVFVVYRAPMTRWMIYHLIEYNIRMFPNKKLQIYINHSIRYYHLSLVKKQL